MVDIAHHIPPQDIRHAGWVLNRAFDAYPAGTWFIGVVDPHVGDPRQKRLACYFPELQKGIVCPDNGLLSRLLHRLDTSSRIRTLDNPAYFYGKHAPSNTFHGRDCYAPAAAHLARAWHAGHLESVFSDLGACLSANDIVGFSLTPPVHSRDGKTLQGEIDVADTYGNLITNIPSDWLRPQAELLTLYAAGKTFSACFSAFYQAIETDNDTLRVVSGSHGCLELALPNASARAKTGWLPGTPISITL